MLLTKHFQLSDGGRDGTRQLEIAQLCQFLRASHHKWRFNRDLTVFSLKRKSTEGQNSKCEVIDDTYELVLASLPTKFG